MWYYFVQMALALVSIATSQVTAAENSCIILCDQVKLPGSKNSPYSIIQCEHKQICMQKLNYTTELVNGRRKNTIRFLHRYCADPRSCIAHCRSTTVNDEPIVSCVSCMNDTFVHEGKKIAEKICYDSNKPIIDPFDTDYDHTPQPETDEPHVEPEVEPDDKEKSEKDKAEKEKDEKEKDEKEKDEKEKDEKEKDEKEKDEKEKDEKEKDEKEKDETDKPNELQAAADDGDGKEWRK